MAASSVAAQRRVPTRGTASNSITSRVSQVARAPAGAQLKVGHAGALRGVRSQRACASASTARFSRGSAERIVCQAAEEPVTTKVEEEEEEGRSFRFYFNMPSKGIADNGIADVKIAPILENSELVICKYDLPFGLNAAPDEASGQVVVGKDAEFPQVEKKGDILRQVTYWPSKKAPALLDVSENVDKWDLVVQALMTNTTSVAEDIVLVFERPNLTERLFVGMEPNETY